MAYREFTDDGGRAWRAWDTYPEKREFVSPGFEDGWLSFEAEGEKRRLVPVPPGWEEGTEVQLRGLLQAARRTAAGKGREET
ncbi:MAG TPA: hypothetical protein VFR37_16545 [Longimicrobium sp.]|nr:hypothetical protein [Longimicrobium sp.]